MASGERPLAPRAVDDVRATFSKRVFVVAGMHRAGTSVVARGLQALGIDLGEQLMPANPQMNARGFFEDLDIVRIDDAVLRALGADWKNVALLDTIEWGAAMLSGLRAEAVALLDARLQRCGCFGFKDPRVPRLLPFWQSVIAELRAADAYVVAVRHPLSVIDSLMARDRLDARRSAWLWLGHLLCALHYTGGRPRVVVDYDRLLAAPERELARIARGLGLPASAAVSEGAVAYSREFLSSELRHAEHTPAEIDANAVPPLVRDAYRLAQRLATDEADAHSTAVREEVGDLFGRLAAFSPLLAYAGAVECAADEVPRLEGELNWARSSLGQATAYSKSLEAAVRTAQEYSDSLKAALDRKEEELLRAHAVLARVRKSLVGRVLVRRITGGR